MAVVQQHEQAPITARLNPFVFPADTNLRFALLIVAVTAASLFAFNWLHSLANQADQSEVIQCQLVARMANPVDPELVESNPDQYRQQLAAQAAASELCIAPFNRMALIWMLCGTLALFMAATVIYLAQPTLQIRRDNLKPLSAAKFQPLRAHLDELQQLADVRQPITFLANPTSRGGGGIAFGRLGRYYIGLSGGLLVRFLRDLEGFDAIILHELAHHRNNDIDITYFAIAVWRAFVVVALIPFAAALVVGFFLFESPALVLDVAWRIVPLALLVYIYHRAVLRSREYYADIRASTWDDSPDALVRVVALSTPPSPGWWTKLLDLSPGLARWWTKQRGPSRIEGRIRQLLALHPEPADRQAALVNPAVIFPISVEDALGIGVVAGVAMPQLSFVAQLLVPTVFEMLAFALGALFVGPLIVGVLGVGIWRSAFAHIFTNRSGSRPFRLTAGLAAGLALGVFISFDTAVPLVGPGEVVPAPFERGLDALFFIAWFVLVFVVFYVFVRWIQSTAEIRLPTLTKYRFLRQALRIDLSIISIFLIFWVAVLFIGYSLGIAGFAVVATAVLSGYTGNAIQFAAPLVIVSSILLWGLPLLAALNRKLEVSHAPRWAFLGTPTTAPIAWSAWSNRALSRFAVLAGLIGGLIAVVLLISMSIGKSLFVSQTVQENEQFLEFYLYLRLSFAALFQAALAGIIAATVPSSGWVYGLCATFFAGVLITLGLLGLSVLNGGAISPDLVWTIYTQVATWSAMLAVPVALACSLFGTVKCRLIA